MVAAAQNEPWITETLSWAEICRRCPDEWVCLVDRTTLPPEMLEAIGYSPRDGLQRTRVRTATGEDHGYTSMLASVTALGITVPDLLVHVFDLDLGPLGDGILGMNFLERFNFEIRPAERRILAEPIAR